MRALYVGKVFTAALACYLMACDGMAHAMTYREAVEVVLSKLWDAQPPGEVLFSDDFSAGRLDKWRADGGWSVVPAPDGTGNCARVVSSDDFEDLISAEHIPVTPGHSIAACFRTRLVAGSEPIYLRVDFFDAEGKTGTPYATQDVSKTGPAWTENTILVSDWFPEYTRQITVHFHVGPKTNTTALLADVRVVDLAPAVEQLLRAEVAGHWAQLKALREKLGRPSFRPLGWRDAVLAALPRVEAALGAAGELELGSEAYAAALREPAMVLARLDDLAEKPTVPGVGAHGLLVYATRPIASQMILPDAAELPGELAKQVVVTACAGEYEPASLVLWALRRVPDLIVEATDLKGPGGTIPAANVDIKWVKCWYQAGSAPHGVAQDRRRKVLVPELLLNDDRLVQVDFQRQRQYLRLFFPNGPRYVPIDDPTDVPWGWKATLEEFPVRDAEKLQPFDLPPRFNKQVWLVAHVPVGTRPSTYKGLIRIASGAQKVAELPLVVHVLPFDLPAPKTHYDMTRDYTGSLYYWGELYPTGIGTIGYKYKSEQQFREELRHMHEHNIVAPIMIWSPETVYGNEALFRRHLQLAKEAGMSGRPLYFGDSGMIGNPTDPLELDRLKERVSRTIAIAAEYGFTDVYFYGLDEATGERLLSQRTAWQAVHEAGGKVIVSGFRGQFEAVGDLLDLCNWAGPPDPSQPALWHAAGHLIWNYANPQTPVEDPAVYRRNYGLYLWRLDWDGTATYCYMDSSGTPWNDFDCDAYRDHNVAYPTTDGIVRTLALEGLREALDDVKYATALRQAIPAAKASRKAVLRHAAEQAEAWLEGLDFQAADLDGVREEMVRRLLELSGHGGV